MSDFLGYVGILAVYTACAFVGYFLARLVWAVLSTLYRVAAYRMRFALRSRKARS